MGGWRDGDRRMDKVEIEIGVQVTRWIKTIVEVIFLSAHVHPGHSAEITPSKTVAKWIRIDSPSIWMMSQSQGK